MEIDNASQIIALDIRKIDSHEGTREALRRSRLYMWRCFPNDLNKKARLAIARRILTELDLKPVKLHYDLYAGCSTCPCSAGYVLHGYYGFEIHADIYLVGSEKHLEAEVKLLTEQV